MTLATVTALVVLEIWQADIDAPFVYRDDSILNLMVVKGSLENDWYPREPAPRGTARAGAVRLPGLQRRPSEPRRVFKLLGLATEEPAAILNASSSSPSARRPHSVPGLAPPSHLGWAGDRLFGPVRASSVSLPARRDASLAVGVLRRAALPLTSSLLC